MPVKPSGEVKTRIIRNTQKNGDIYVLERQIAYDPDKKQNRVLSTKLLSKIPKGTEIPVPTRPKNAKAGTNAELAPTNDISNGQNSDRLTASRMRVGMMNIIDHIKSGLGKDNDDSVQKSKQQIKLEKKLLSWLENTPIYLQLQWFDVIEGVKISSKLKSVRWATETTAVDNLYLEKLGMSTEMICV